MSADAHCRRVRGAGGNGAYVSLHASKPYLASSLEEQLLPVRFDKPEPLDCQVSRNELRVRKFRAKEQTGEAKEAVVDTRSRVLCLHRSRGLFIGSSPLIVTRDTPFALLWWVLWRPLCGFGR